MDSSSFSNERQTYPDAQLLPISGGTCQCYRVRLYGRLHFLKQLKPELRTDPRYVAALRKEFETGYQLDHPHLVRYMSLSDDSILMEYVDGETLNRFIDHHPEYFKKKENADRFVFQLLNVVGYLHQHQIVHLDLKPSNILVTRVDSDVKLIDLGFSYTDSYADTIGYTAGFAAPEQLDGSTLPDARTDIYAIGKILEQLPCAKRYARVIKRCMAVNPAMRYPSVAEVARQVRGRRVPSWPWLLVFFFLEVALSAFFIFQHQKHRPDNKQEVSQAEMQAEEEAEKQLVQQGQHGEQPGRKDDTMTMADGKRQDFWQEHVDIPETTHVTTPSSPVVGTTREKAHVASLNAASLRKEFHSLCMPVFNEELVVYRDSSYQSVGFIRFNQVSTRFRDKMYKISDRLWESRYKASGGISERDFIEECTNIIHQYINTVYDEMILNDQKQ